MQRVRVSADIRDANLKKIAREMEERLRTDRHAYDLEKSRPWVLRDGGTHFACANRSCVLHALPVNADENAAANIGLRFLRGFEGIRVTINDAGAVTKPVGHISPGTVLKSDHSDSVSFWVAITEEDGLSRKKSARGQSASMAENLQDREEETGGERYLFRDPSGRFLRAERWYTGKDFWTRVAAACANGIRAVNANLNSAASE